MKTIQISDQLYNDLEHFLNRSSFTDMSALASYILTEYLNMQDTDEPDDFEDDLNSRLKDLGYF